MKFSSLCAATVLLASSAAVGTTALPAEHGPILAGTAAEDEWHFTLGLYGWGAGLNGDLGAGGFVAPVDISFSDLLNTLDMTAMGAAEIRRGNWLLQVEGLYLRNSIKGAVAYTPFFGNPITAKLTAETTRLEAVAGYRIVDNGRTTFDLLAGVVYYDIENTLNFYGPRAARGVGSGYEWLDPVFGFRVEHRLSDRWSARLRGEVGGFGVNADLVWQAVALLGYDLTESTTGFIGWRHAAVDYRNGGFIYDAYSTGPILGLTLSF